MQFPADPPPNTPAGGRTDNLLRLPFRAQRLGSEAAAIYLGVPPLRLRLMAFVNAGPPLSGTSRVGEYRVDDLDAYIAALYRKAGISETEMSRKRQAGAAEREAALSALAARKGRETLPLPPADPFMLLSTRGELIEETVFMMIKAMVLFAIIMLFLSISPLLKTHF